MIYRPGINGWLARCATFELIVRDCLACVMRERARAPVYVHGEMYIHLARTHVARSIRDEEIDDGGGGGGGKRRARKGERRK